MSCCLPRKLFNRRPRREDVYKVNEEAKDEKPGDVPQENNEAPKFSWEKREKVDPAQYTVTDIHGEFHKRVGNGNDPMQIDNCSEAAIFLLKPTSSITIDDCRDCLMILGPCSGSVFIRDSSNCVILSACQQFRTRDSHDIRIGLLCPTQPIIEQSNGVHFHPLSLNYPDFKSHMLEAGLSPFTNRVRSVHDFTPESGFKNFKIHDSIIKLTSEHLEQMTSNDIHSDIAQSILPVFNAINMTEDSARYIVTMQEGDESKEDFTDRGLTLIQLIKTSEDVKLMSCHDIEMKQIDRKMIPFEGKFDNLLVFQVIGNEDEMESICKENFNLFKLVDHEQADYLKAAIQAFNAKRN